MIQTMLGGRLGAATARAIDAAPVVARNWRRFTRKVRIRHPSYVVMTESETVKIEPAHVGEILWLLVDPTRWLKQAGTSGAGPINARDQACSPRPSAEISRGNDGNIDRNDAGPRPASA